MGQSSIKVRAAIALLLRQGFVLSSSLAAPPFYGQKKKAGKKNESKNDGAYAYNKA